MAASAPAETAPSGPPDEQHAAMLPDPAMVAAKKLQNVFFKRFGSTAWFFGVLGFLPSSLAGLYHGVPWSASHWNPHDKVDAWLVVHCFSMWLWVVAAAAQFSSGGRPDPTLKKIHRLTGYLGFGALSCGMLCGGLIYTLKTDIPARRITACYYAVAISLAAWGNMCIAVNHARKHRTAEHKDFVLMAFMWTMDPAVQRALLHLLRFGCVTPDGSMLLIAGKLCANVFLAAVFGCAAVWGGRENATLVLNIAGQWANGIAFVFIVVVASQTSAMDERDKVFFYTVAIICCALLVIMALVYTWSRCALLRHWRPTAANRIGLFLLVLGEGGLVASLFMPQAPA